MQIKNSAISHFESLSVTLLSFSGLFIRNCNFVASFGFAALDDVASAFGFHPFASRGLCFVFWRMAGMFVLA